NTENGQVRIKTAKGWGVEREKVEYEDRADIARKMGLSLTEIDKLL
ncbi:MAG: DUF111 family protein, partial [Bacilli bacterium]|nr:DUF111 family protein [Bacilli bacterium]